LWIREFGSVMGIGYLMQHRSLEARGHRGTEASHYLEVKDAPVLAMLTMSILDGGYRHRAVWIGLAGVGLV
jgi:hypothetical protein